MAPSSSLLALLRYGRELSGALVGRTLISGSPTRGLGHPFWFAAYHGLSRVPIRYVVISHQSALSRRGTAKRCVTQVLWCFAWAFAVRVRSDPTEKGLSPFADFAARAFFRNYVGPIYQ